MAALTETVRILNAQLEGLRHDLDEERERSRELWQYLKEQRPQLQAPDPRTPPDGITTMELPVQDTYTTASQPAEGRGRRPWSYRAWLRRFWSS